MCGTVAVRVVVGGGIGYGRAVACWCVPSTLTPVQSASDRQQRKEGCACATEAREISAAVPTARAGRQFTRCPPFVRPLRRPASGRKLAGAISAGRQRCDAKIVMRVHFMPSNTSSSTSSSLSSSSASRRPPLFVLVGPRSSSSVVVVRRLRASHTNNGAKRQKRPRSDANPPQKWSQSHPHNVGRFWPVFEANAHQTPAQQKRRNDDITSLQR